MIPLPRFTLAVSEHVSPETLLPPLVPRTLVAVPIGKLINSESVNLVPEILSRISIPVPAQRKEKFIPDSCSIKLFILQELPEMVRSEAVLHPALEFPHVAASVGASLNAEPVALTVDPLPGVTVAGVEAINPGAVP